MKFFFTKPFFGLAGQLGEPPRAVDHRLLEAFAVDIRIRHEVGSGDELKGFVVPGLERLVVGLYCLERFGRRGDFRRIESFGRRDESFILLAEFSLGGIGRINEPPRHKRRCQRSTANSRHDDFALVHLNCISTTNCSTQPSLPKSDDSTTLTESPTMAESPRSFAATIIEAV